MYVVLCVFFCLKLERGNKREKRGINTFFFFFLVGKLQNSGNCASLKTYNFWWLSAALMPASISVYVCVCVYWGKSI